MIKCDYNGCGEEGIYLLLYSVDEKIYEEHGMSGDCWDFEKNCCGKHLEENNFLFDVHHGFPKIVYNLKESREEKLSSLHNSQLII